MRRVSFRSLVLDVRFSFGSWRYSFGRSDIFFVSIYGGLVIIRSYCIFGKSRNRSERIGMTLWIRSCFSMFCLVIVSAFGEIFIASIFVFGKV